jgi:LysR family glycine cleavage system transcriptional activator
LRPLGPDGIDVALRYGNGDWPGTEAKLVLPTPVVVVGAPSLVGEASIMTVADLVDVPWLQELGTTEATRFLKRRGMAHNARRGLISLHGNLMLDAVRDGQGVAAIARAFVAADIAARRLRLLFQDGDRQGYFLVTPPGVLRPSVRAFATWVTRRAKSG